MAINRLITLQIGQLVKVRSGRDAGSIAVIISILDDKFVMIADGDKRKFDQPKRKNVAHLEFQTIISSEVVNSLNETGKVTNGKLRHAVSMFKQSIHTNVEEKGD